MTSSKILNMYHLLTDVYKAKVEKVAEQRKKGEPATLIITLTINGEVETFNSRTKDFEDMVVTLARKDFNEPFTGPNLMELNQRLEAVATSFRVR
jgi:hypothetical protein